MLIFRRTQYILDENLEQIKKALEAKFGQEFLILPHYLEFCGEVVTKTRRDEEGEKE